MWQELQKAGLVEYTASPPKAASPATRNPTMKNRNLGFKEKRTKR
jgi:hypothetical protein